MELSSKNKTFLLMSDPHQEIGKVEYLLNHENFDIAICLGDWFDSFNYNSEKDAEKTCLFLKKWLFKPNFFTTIGNHDIQYLWGNPASRCGGYYSWKDKLITEIFGSEMPVIRKKFLWYIWVDDFLCSHAGVNTYHFPPHLEINKKSISRWLNREIESAEMTLINNGYHWLYGAGAARGGRQNIGGITWQDFNCEFEQIEGLKQIVGHTSHNNILPHYLEGNLNYTESENLDIDCHLSEYLIIKNGKLTIKKYLDL